MTIRVFHERWGDQLEVRLAASALFIERVSRAHVQGYRPGMQTGRILTGPYGCEQCIGVVAEVDPHRDELLAPAFGADLHRWSFLGKGRNLITALAANGTRRNHSQGEPCLLVTTANHAPLPEKETRIWHDMVTDCFCEGGLGGRCERKPIGYATWCTGSKCCQRRRMNSQPPSRALRKGDQLIPEKADR